MKTRLLLLLGIFVGLLSMGRVFGDEVSARIRPPDELDELFGPIALYPDALVALILPASTVSSDVVMAARYLDSNGDMTKIDGQGWDDSVVDLMHYPDLIKWLDENLAWTKQAGEAFQAQQDDVMNSIQRLRAKARAAGTLVDTPQQHVVVEGDQISIVPTQPNVIYVPSYDPDVVYVSRPGVVYNDPFLSFGVGYSTGFWLGYDFDWGHHRIWTIDRRDRERYWSERHDWRRPYYPGRPDYRDNPFHQQPWKPPVHATHVPSSRPSENNRSRPEIHRPIPYPDRTPDHRPDGRRSEPDVRPDNQAHSRERSSGYPGHSNDRPEAGSKPATVVVPVVPSSRPSRSSQPATNADARPAQSPPAQSQKARDERESHGHDQSEGTRTPNPQGRVVPLQPTPQTQPSVQSSASHHTVQPQQEPQQSHESDRDQTDRRNSRQ